MPTAATPHAPASNVIEVELPFATVSESNTRESHYARHGRAREQMRATYAGLCRCSATWRLTYRPKGAPKALPADVVELFIRDCKCPRPPAPVLVTLSRVGLRQLDPGNHEVSFKHVQDAVSRWLRIDDGDVARIRFVYLPQTRAATRKDLATRVRIETVKADTLDDEAARLRARLDEIERLKGVQK